MSKISLTRLARRIKDNLFYNPSSAERVHRYWEEPWDGANSPEDYANVNPARSRLLIHLVKDIMRIKLNEPIIEFGPNIGRNLIHLQNSGYTDLHGIEISGEAVDAMKSKYPSLKAQVIHSSVEDAAKDLRDNQYKLGYSMAVFQHIPYSSNWVFKEITRSCENILTIENEWERGWRHYPRKYKPLFERLGLEQFVEGRCEEVGLTNYNWRSFRRNKLG